MWFFPLFEINSLKSRTTIMLFVIAGSSPRMIHMRLRHRRVSRIRGDNASVGRVRGGSCWGPALQILRTQQEQRVHIMVRQASTRARDFSILQKGKIVWIWVIGSRFGSLPFRKPTRRCTQRRIWRRTINHENGLLLKMMDQHGRLTLPLIDACYSFWYDYTFMSGTFHCLVLHSLNYFGNKLL
jgi:hypothetical protein